MRLFAFLLILAACSFAYTIESYRNDVLVLGNGDIHVHENITFNLPSRYNEGFRTIRAEDAPSLNHVVVHSVKVNGEPIEAYAQVYQGDTEIVWKKTEAGINVVELDYTLRDRVEIWDDFARLCYEHYGAGWTAPARIFRAQTFLPPSTNGKEMHFEVYSERKGVAYVEDLSVVIEMDQVPPGNYIGGCYLFDRDSVNSSRIMNGSALERLESERDMYGSESVYGGPLPMEFCCVPAALILALFAVNAYIKRPRVKAAGESILPPEDEEPVLVSALLKNSVNEKDLLAATLLDLINRGKIDIVELEKKGETSAQVKKERTILMLRKTGDLRDYERAAVDMIFSESKEVELDKLMEKAGAITTKKEAQASPVLSAFESFKAALMKPVDEKFGNLIKKHSSDVGLAVTILFFSGVAGLILFAPAAEAAFYYIENGMVQGWAIVASFAVSMASAGYAAYVKTRPRAPKGMEDRFSAWMGFSNALSSSRIKEYPPSSVAIWGRIMVYATALGKADKVKRHLSELDALTRERLDEMELVRNKSVGFYASAIALSNLSKYGNRTGYSSRSSGGWSSGGGGGFSGGSSGGGGFR